SPPLRAAYARVRQAVSAYDQDRFLSPEIEAVAAVVRTGTLAHDAGAVCGTLE
ncbi:MAG: histidine ammonia-lyase, partial [Acidobacteria bacterium]